MTPHVELKLLPEINSLCTIFWTYGITGSVVKNATLGPLIGVEPVPPKATPGTQIRFGRLAPKDTQEMP